MLALISLLAVPAAAGTANPRALILTLRDLPAGFSVDKSRPRSNKDAATDGTSVAQIRRWGRIAGWQASYSREPTLKGVLAGPLDVRSSVSVYQTAAGADAAFAHYAHNCDKPGFTRLSIGAPLGHEAAFCKTQRASGSDKADLYVVLWRRGDVYAVIVVGGLAGAIDPTDAVVLAKRQDERIAAAR